MKGKTHFYAGVLVVLFFLFFSKINLENLIFSLFFLIGCMFPDIDHMNSIVGKKFKIIGWAFKHRGFFHSLFGLILISLIFYPFNVLVSIFFALGYLLHLLLDMLSKKGVKLFIIGPSIKGELIVGEFSETLISFVFKISIFVLIFFLFFI